MDVGGIVSLAIIILVGIAFLNIMVISAREVAIWLLLRQYGKVGELAVEGLCYKPTLKRNYQIRFRPPNDETYVVQSIRDKTYKRLQERTVVTVAYLPNRPHVARLWSNDSDNVSRDVSTLIVLVLIVFASLKVTAWPLVGVWLLTVVLFYLVPQILNRPLFRRIDSWECAE